ncbi:MAG TPA: hypothetical protein DEQ30_05645, partial [Porphyromonadaceae bacterium]|nr:hypothetical protein [Porphyromonadaceae bacterium]
KLIIFAGALLLLAVGTVGFFASRSMSAEEALILKNVEAIAQNENGGGNVCKWGTALILNDELVAICHVEGAGYECTCGEVKHD